MSRPITPMCPDEGEMKTKATPAAASATSQHLELPKLQQKGSGLSLLQRIHLKHSRKERMRNLGHWSKQSRKQERMGQLLSARRKEFEQRPEKERKELQEAFEKHDINHSGSLDPKELLDCLADFGLKWKTLVEQKELQTICNEVVVLGDVDFLNFCFELA